ncbi:MAG TPA: PKD domain-containing protein, partial [Solirubrobacteraceae bacterium]
NDAAGATSAYLSQFGESFTDTHDYPANGCHRTAICLTDAQLQAELVRFVAEHGLPTDLTHEYFLLTPPKVESCFEAAGNECSAGAPEGFAAYCAYHGNIPIAEGHELIYANDPYVTGNPGCDDGNHPNGASDGALQGGLSHEHNESITDPEPDSAWPNLVGDEAGEIGDKCNGATGTALGATGGGAEYNQEINGHFYWYQEEWSNQGHSCLQRLAFTGEVPKAAFSSSAGPGEELKLNAGTSTAPGGVSHYSWQFNDGPEGLSNPSETALSSLSHTFPCPATYTVALTVYAADGTSNGMAHAISVNPGAQVKPTASFALPGGAIAGAPLAFDGSASSGCPAVTGYGWDFGDGSPQQGGSTPAHTYAAAGSYEVTLHVIDKTGLIGSVTHTIVVAPASVPPVPALAESSPVESAATALTLTPPPATPAAPSAAVALAASTAQVQSTGRTALKLTCFGTASACAGRIVLTAKVFGRGHRARTVTLAAVSFTIPAGRTSTVALRLGAQARALLRAQHGHLSAQIALSKTSPAPAQVQRRSVRLVLARHR